MQHTAKAQLFIVCLTPVVCLWVLCGCQTAPARAQQAPGALSKSSADFADALAAYSRGLTHQMHGRYEAALTNYIRALRLDPDNNDIYMSVAMGYLRQQKPGKALEVIQSLCDRKPHETQPRLWLGFMQRIGGQPDDAIKTYRHIISRSPKEAEAYLQLASLYVRQGKDKKAMALLSKAEKRVEAPEEVLRLLTDLYIQGIPISKSGKEADDNRRAAVQTLTKLVEIDNDDVTSLFQLADLYILDNKMDEAAACLKRIEELDRSDLQVKKRLALSYAAVGMQDKAVETLEAIVEEKPTNPHVYYYLGELYERLGEKERAILNYRLATTSEPPEPEAYLRLALLQVNAKPEEARQTLQEGLRRLPGNARLTETIACMYLNQKAYDEAVRYFAEAEDIITGAGAGSEMSPLLSFYYALACQHAGHIEKASGLLATTIKKNSVFLDTYAQYILQKANEGLLEEGCTILESIIDDLPNNERLLLVYIGLFNSLSDLYDKAILAFEKALDLKDRESAGDRPLDAIFYFWYGAACERDGRLERAADLFHKCIALNPKYAEAYNYLAYMWAEKGVNMDKASEYIGKALELEPDSGAFIDTLGWIYYMQGRYPEALEQIRKAASILPEDPTIAEHLGDILLKLGQEDEALAHWKRAFMLDPKNEGIAEKLNQGGINPASLLEESTTSKKSVQGNSHDSGTEE